VKAEGQFGVKGGGRGILTSSSITRRHHGCAAGLTDAVGEGAGEGERCEDEEGGKGEESGKLHFGFELAKMEDL
jgi:hypothetical protein